MKYGDAIDATRPSLVMQRKLFENILLPVTGEPLKQFMEYFCHQAYEAWRYGVSKNDLDNASFVEQICKELYRNHKDEFLKLANAVMEEANNVSDILYQSERGYYEAEKDGNDSKLKSSLDHYKTLFEAALRLWSSIPYFYAVRVLGIESKVKNGSDFLRVSSGEKFHCLRVRKILLPQGGKLSDLVDVFSNELRNAGGGHDSYEFLDDGSVQLNISNPKSGKTRTANFDYEQIKIEIDRARKAIWTLRNGFMIFLNKNPEILAEVVRTKPLKLREIKSALGKEARNLLFKLLDFSFDDKQKKVVLTLEKKKQIGGHSTEIFFSTGQRLDIITIAIEVNLDKQLFGLLQVVTAYMVDHYPLEQLDLIFLDEEGVRYQATYLADTVSESSKKDKVLPQPIDGVLPTGAYDMRSQVSVPYGMGKIIGNQMKIEGYRVIS